jgi:hypothetical protein
VETIYPSLFHIFYGLIKCAIGFNSIQIIQVIVLVDFLALFAAFYYCATAFLQNAEEASLCVLSLSLVIYAPTSHYILLPEPSSFSFVFVLLSIGALYRYAMHSSAGYLILGSLTGSLAVNIWWPNFFSFLAIVVVLAYHLLRNRKPPALHVAIFIFASLVPCMHTAWHLYSIRDIFPYYFSGTTRQGHVAVYDILISWIVTFLTKGNLPFMHHMNLWDPSEASSRTTNLLASGTRRLHAIASAIHYFVLVMPFNFFLVAFAIVNLFQKETTTMCPRLGLLRTLAMGGFAVLLCSSMVLFLDNDVGKVRRVHFIISIMFLLFAFATAPVVVHSVWLQKSILYIKVAAICALAYTVVYSPRLFTSKLPEPDNAIIQFIGSIPDRNHQRIFMFGDGLRRVAPFVRLQSFVELNQGKYYHQDPHTAFDLYQDFMIMKEKSNGWKSVAREKNIKWIILRTSEAAELEMLRRYESDGVLQYKNRDWAALELNL